jgi:hypothetical protein
MNTGILIRNLLPEDTKAVWTLDLQAFDRPSEGVIWEETMVELTGTHQHESTFGINYMGTEPDYSGDTSRGIEIVAKVKEGDDVAKHL